MEFGWSLPKRMDYFKRAVESAGETHRVQFQGEQKILNVIRVPIDLPKYRLQNGRTVSLQSEWLSEHATEPKDMFRADPENERAQRVQHELLRKLVPGARLQGHFQDPTNKQLEPLYLDSHGFVVNGNRRLCCWRDLYQQNAQKYSHFSHVQAIVLPQADDRAIDRLEAECTDS